MDVALWVWGALLAGILAMLAVDLFMHRDAHGMLMVQLAREGRQRRFDFWRYLPGRGGTVDVRATSSTGETCSIRLRA